MKYPDTEITGISELINKLDAQRGPNDIVWFRGQANSAWTISPSIFRSGTNPLDREVAMFKRFRQNAGKYVDARVTSDWDWFLLMQHHSVPTRLLDWSESPLIGLYFAVEEGNDSEDGFLYLFLPVEYNLSRSVSYPVRNDLPLIGSDNFIEAYWFINKDPGLYEELPLAVIAQRNSERIFAQQGVFVIYGTKHESFETLANAFLWRHKIAAGNKPRIRKELEAIGISKSSVFPELGNLADQIKRITQ